MIVSEPARVRGYARGSGLVPRAGFRKAVNGLEDNREGARVSRAPAHI
ncbi:hypothetical protein SAMN04488518_11367 [Pseudovibrio ascidiaceicola]|uniref:Uncharacterized protein n=1 Tax=Pseudovibrio ascidiaceicola TaxID=285279 RepID=A0A1I4E1R1_9HYPH|nr:hypothetical protein SAMN04488518_11367 [Pseudovibrio ascidiaceicola]